MRKFWQEIFGICFYYSESIGYFYAWNYKSARKKATIGKLFVVNDFGEKCLCGK